MRQMKKEVVKQKILNVMKTFPTSYKGFPYLTLKNGDRMFFSLFFRKYGFDGSKVKYNEMDMLRRARVFESLDFIVHNYDPVESTNKQGTPIYKIESEFHRLIVLRRKNGKSQLLSIYPLLRA